MKRMRRFHNPLKCSIRVKFTLMFILIMAAAIACCILANLYFLEDYYLEKKKNTVVQEIEKINAVLDERPFGGSSADLDDELTEDMENLLRQCWSQYNISAVIIGNDGNILFRSSTEMIDLQKRLMQYVFDGNVDMKKMYENEQYKIVMFQESHGTRAQVRKAKTRYMDAFGFLNSGCSFLLSTPVESIKESADISNRFFMLTGLAAAVIAGTYIFFAMKRMTQPIFRLSEIASRMAKQDFTARYQGNFQNEIGTLGNSMNHMSEELEKTIMELKTANEQLQRDIEEKIQIDDMRKEFLSNVSHELKTPIALIQGYAEGLQDCVNDDPESRDFYCEVIMDEAGKMNQMVQKLLNLNHLEFGNNACEMVVFDLGEMIRTMMESTRILLTQKEGTISYEQKLSNMEVVGDEFMIEEVLKNYISNACNHLEGRREVRILAEPVSSGGSNDARQTADVLSRDPASAAKRVRVSVYNTGNPIPEEDLDKVWIKFFKVDKARTREYGGSGIGLSIVKAIMEQHECPYGVYNVEDGVVFWFELNLAANQS